MGEKKKFWRWTAEEHLENDLESHDGSEMEFFSLQKLSASPANNSASTQRDTGAWTTCVSVAAAKTAGKMGSAPLRPQAARARRRREPERRDREGKR